MAPESSGFTRPGPPRGSSNNAAAAASLAAQQDPQQLMAAARFMSQQDPQHVAAAGRFMAAQHPQQVAVAGGLLAQQDPHQAATAGRLMAAQSTHIRISSSQSDARAFVASVATTVSKPPAPMRNDRRESIDGGSTSSAAAAPSSLPGSHPHPQTNSRRQAAQSGPLEGMTVDPGCCVHPSLAVLKGLQSGFAGCSSPLDSVTDEVTLNVSHRDSTPYIWAHPAFLDLLADPYQSRAQRRQQLAPSFATMLHSVELVAAALQRTAETTGGKPLLAALEVLQTSLAHTLSPFPAPRSDHGADIAALHGYLDSLLSSISGLTVGGSLLVPGGLVRVVPKKKRAATESIQEQLARLQAAAAAAEEETEERALSMMEHMSELASSVAATVAGTLASTREFVAKEMRRAMEAAGVGDTEWEHAPMLFVLHRAAHDSYSLAVVNTGVGTEYHPMSPDPNHGGGLLRSMSLVLHDIPAGRATNPMWWFLATRALACPAQTHSPALLYERLLPFLNARPLLANTASPGLPIPRGGDPSRVHLVLEALRNVLAFAGVAEAHAASARVYIGWQVCKRTVRDLMQLARSHHRPSAGVEFTKASGGLNQWDSRLLASAARSLAAHALSAGALPRKHLAAIRRTILQMEALRLELTPSQLPRRVPDRADAGLRNHGTPAAATFPYFGRLRRDTSVERLKGRTPLPPIQLPIEMSKMADSVATLAEAAVAVRDAAQLCCLLDNQTDSVQHTLLHRAALVHHLVLRVLPLPMPHHHPERGVRCLWAQPMPCYLQTDLLHQLHLLTMHYAAVAASLPVTRHGDATRLLVLGCLACVADAVLRVAACDRPSPLSLQYNGTASGPGKPFGFDVGYYAIISENACYAAAEMARARTQMLDYFAAQASFLTPSHTVLGFETGDGAMGSGDELLLKQLSLVMGFPVTQDAEGLQDGTLARYLTGEDPRLTKHVPELAPFRDIVFYFKLFMSAERTALPDVRRWRAADASLSWSSCEVAPSVAASVVGTLGGGGGGGRHRAAATRLSAVAFGKPLSPQGLRAEDERKGDGVMSQMWEFVMGSKSRAPPSFGDPRQLLGNEHVQTEDDVLHLPALPTFGGRLSARQTELLLSYLTVPYLRIPLVLQFFADPTRIVALNADALQYVLDAVVFEPGLWQREANKALPEAVPVLNTRDHRATPGGLLINELCKSPTAVLDAVTRMVACMLDLDEGKYGEHSSPVILYTVRLAVRIEAYVLLVLRHTAAAAAATKAGNTSAAAMRGVRVSKAARATLRAHVLRMRTTFAQRLVPMLTGWCEKAMQDNQHHQASITHAHLAYMHCNLEYAAMDAQAVRVLLVAQMWVRAHHNLECVSEADGGSAAAAEADLGATTQRMGMDPVELFEVFQAQRRNVLGWMHAHPDQWNPLLESLVERLSVEPSKWTHRYESDGSALASSATGAAPTTAAAAASLWQESAPLGCPGVFRRRRETAAEDVLSTAAEAAMTLEEWLRHKSGTQMDTEINVQLGQLTVSSQHVRTLPADVYEMEDFQTLFGASAGRVGMRCNLVEKAAHRTWYRLEGHHYDLQLWEPDERQPHNRFLPVPDSHAAAKRLALAASAARAYPSGLAPGEMWVQSILHPLLSAHDFQLDLMMSTTDCSTAACAHLCGRLLSADDLTDGVEEPLREVVVLRDPPAVHVFNLLEHGRRWYMELVFSSDADTALHTSLPTQVVELYTGCPNYIMGRIGQAAFRPPRARSLVVLRSIPGQVAQQKFVPGRLLRGLLPEGLVQNYQFWQNKDDSLTGYLTPEAAQAAKVPSVLKVQLLKEDHGKDVDGMGVTNAAAVVTRVPVLPECSQGVGGMGFQSERHDARHPTHMLLNLLHVDATYSPQLAALRELLMRLDSLSHCLVWLELVEGSHTPAVKSHTACVDLIELPRLKLTFRARAADPSTHELGAAANSRLYLDGHADLFLSNHRAPGICKFLEGLPSAVLLENSLGEASLLLPATAKPARLQMDPRRPFATALVLQRNDARWCANLPAARHYLYPVHLSRAFLAITSLASALYLLLMRLMDGRYDDAFHVAQWCFSDTAMTGEEHQIWCQLATVMEDQHPDAYACRLRLSLLARGSATTMSLPWDYHLEFERYAEFRRSVSAACRLSPEEEWDLADEAARLGLKNVHVQNRLYFLTAMFKSRDHDPTHTLPLSCRFKYPDREVPSGSAPFERLQDDTCLQNSAPPWASLQWLVDHQSSYTRPDTSVETGSEVLALFHSWLCDGVEGSLRLSSLKDSHRRGFLFFYELLTGTLQLLPSRHYTSHGVGSVLLRLLPEADTEKGLLMSVLRVLEANPTVAAGAPRFKVPEASVFSSMFSGDDTYIKSFVTDVLQYLRQRAKDGAVKLPAAYAAPAAHWLRKATATTAAAGGGGGGGGSGAGAGGGAHPAELLSPARVEFAPYGELLHADRTLVRPYVSDHRCKQQALRPFSLQDDKGQPLCLTSEDIAAFAGVILSPVHLESFVKQTSRAERGMPPVAGDFPFVVTSHPCAQPTVARDMAARLQADVAYFASVENESRAPQLRAVLGEQVDAAAAAAQVAQLRRALATLRAQSQDFVHRALDYCELLTNSAADVSDRELTAPQLRFLLGQLAHREPLLEFELLVGLTLCSTGDADLQRMNPCLGPELVQTSRDLTFAIMLHVNRLSHLSRCQSMADDLQRALGALAPTTTKETASDSADDARREIRLRASQLAAALMTERHCVRADTRAGAPPGAVRFDPRFLTFEFINNLVMRRQQYQLVTRFLKAAANGDSLCHQMIMGAGKTTVVAPLLALILCDGERLLTQVMPGALLEMTRAVMRQAFAVITPKAVYTFDFNRRSVIDANLLKSMQSAQETGSVVCATPQSVKAFVLKLVEMLHVLDTEFQRRASGGGVANARSTLSRFFTTQPLSRSPMRTWSSAELAELRTQVQLGVEVFHMFHSGVLLMDEVDLILHPLKSELNWPLGAKVPLDLTSMNGVTHGLRWQIPYVLLDAFCFSGHGRVSVGLGESRIAMTVLESISRAIDSGCAKRLLQRTPHVVILSRSFYHAKLRPLLARWLLCWLKRQHLAELSWEEALQYLLDGPRSAVAGVFEEKINDQDRRVLNLSHDWLMRLLPFVLGKINRVSFGLLSPEQRTRAITANQEMPMSRQLLALPFVGKDLPSDASEFAHPDVVIGLTILAYRYEGLRRSDFDRLIKSMRTAMLAETGAYATRTTWNLYAKWVALNGGRVRGVKPEQQQEYFRGTGPALQATCAADGESTTAAQRLPQTALTRSMTSKQLEHLMDTLWPLSVLNVRAEEHMEFMFRLLRKEPCAIQRYLFDDIFPETMEFQEYRLTANAQELGGDIMFGTRLGFSGTPSNLLPEELKPCFYEKGDDGRMIHYLTQPSVLTVEYLDAGWTPHAVLDRVAVADPPVNALIDTGALVTGLTNHQVAQYLLRRGLAGFGGVVFLDHADRKMVLRRHEAAAVPLEQCGLGVAQRFSFYDQVHTTGMDIQQALNACAVLTLGKDMTFREYAQGAFRMRGIGSGQTIRVYMIPEVQQLVETHVSRARAETVAAYRARLAALPTEAARRSQVLQDVTTWLILSSMKSEKTQFNLCCEHSARNIWRKAAWKNLIENASMVGTKQADAFTNQCLNVYRDRMVFNVDSGVAQPQSTHSKIAQRASEARQCGFLTQQSEMALLERIQDSLASHGGDADADARQLHHLLEQEQEQEQQQEQEQEQEQEEEQEQEQELEVDLESAESQTYSKEDQATRPWLLSRLQQAPAEASHGFYKARQLTTPPLIHDTLEFPESLLVSANHTRRDWREAHRLKNVVMLMEYVPEARDLSSFISEEHELTASQQQAMAAAFELYGGGGMGRAEVVHFLETMGWDGNVVEEDGIPDKVLAAVKAGKVTLSQLQALKRYEQHFGIQQGRYYVVLTLQEAETVRAAIHERLNAPLFAGHSASVSLRCVAHTSTGLVLDCSFGFSEGSRYQTQMVAQCAKFIDADSGFTPEGAHLLLQLLERTPAATRQHWFDASRRCRRRKQSLDPASPLAVVFGMADSFQLLELRALCYRVRRLVMDRGLFIFDAFTRFNVSASTQLTCSELMSGVAWLGLSLTEQQVHAIVRRFDTDGDGCLGFEDFKRAFHVAGDDQQVLAAHSDRSAADQSGGGVDPLQRAPPQPDEDFKIPQRHCAPLRVQLHVATTTAGRELADGDLAERFQVHRLPMGSFFNTGCTSVYTSQGSGVKELLTVWQPEDGHSMGMAGTSKYVCVGYYASVDAASPQGACVLRITDTSSMFNTSALDWVLTRFTPHPKGYNLVWAKQVGDQHLFVWEPRPPSAAFVAMGMVATVTAQSPALEACRCVPRKWVVASADSPVMLWRDSGSGGEPGSIWKTNDLCTLFATKGHNAPGVKSRLSLKRDAFFLRPNDDSDVADDSRDQLAPTSKQQIAAMQALCLEHVRFRWSARSARTLWTSSHGQELRRPALKDGQVFFGDLAHGAEHALIANDYDGGLFVKAVGWEPVWYRERGSSSSALYVWQPVSPSAEYVAVGHVVTVTPTMEPDADAAYRLIHKALLRRVKTCDAVFYKYAGWGGLGGTCTLWHAPPPWGTFVGHTSGELPAGPFHCIEPTLLPEAITRVPAEARQDYHPPDQPEYESCIALKVCSVLGEPDWSTAGRLWGRRCMQRGDKVWILDFQYDTVLHWVTGYCEARPEQVGNIALHSVSIKDTAYTRLLARLEHKTRGDA